MYEGLGMQADALVYGLGASSSLLLEVSWVEPEWVLVKLE